MRSTLLRKAVEKYVNGLPDQLHGRAYNLTEPVSRQAFIEELDRRVHAVVRMAMAIEAEGREAQ